MAIKDRITRKNSEGVDVTVTRYKFRAELAIDALRFFSLIAETEKHGALVNMRINPLHFLGEGDDSEPTCEALASFGTTLSKEALLRLMEAVPDGHVIEGTIAEESDYTGIRRISSDVPFMARTKETTLAEALAALQRPV